MDFTSDLSGNTGSTNPGQGNGMIYAEQTNPFTTADNNPIEWDFGNASFGNRARS